MPQSVQCPGKGKWWIEWVIFKSFYKFYTWKNIFYTCDVVARDLAAAAAAALAAAAQLMGSPRMFGIGSTGPFSSGIRGKCGMLEPVAFLNWNKSIQKLSKLKQNSNNLLTLVHIYIYPSRPTHTVKFYIFFHLFLNSKRDNRTHAWNLDSQQPVSSARPHIGSCSDYAITHQTVSSQPVSQ